MVLVIREPESGRVFEGWEWAGAAWGMLGSDLQREGEEEGGTLMEEEEWQA